jgi:ketosteroid isomerase-like protein
MSEENVEIMREWIALNNARDAQGIVELLAPDFVSIPAENEPEAAVLQGPGAFGRRQADAFETFEKYEIEVSEYIDLGEYVVVVGHIEARGSASHAEVSADEVWLCRFRDGKVVEARECSTIERALEAAGRSP